MRTYASLKERSFVLLANAAIAFFVFWWATGSLIPTGGVETVWLVCAISYWFLGLLSAPWFVPPRDAIISAVGALLVLIPMDISSAALFVGELEQTRKWLIGFSVVVVVLAIYSLFMHDKDGRSATGKFAFRLTSIFGRGEVLFSGPAVVSIVAAHQTSFAQMSWLLLFWILVVVGKPMERIMEAVRKLAEDSGDTKALPTVGHIDRIDHPHILRVKLASGSLWPNNRLFTASLPNGEQQYVVSLFSQVQGAEVVGTGLVVATAAEKIDLPAGTVCASHDEGKTKDFLSKLSGSADAKLVGFVVENSTIGVIAFEVAARSELREGDVVFANLSGFDVFYQIIGAETVEESFDQNPRGTHVVRAAQLGQYAPDAGFTKYGWLPSMNTPLFSASSRIFEEPIVSEREFKIGKVPSTNIDAIARLDDLVEYHTAILGVTGTGKTEVALDLVRNAIQRGVKVFCVDFTGDYKERLSDLNPIFPTPEKEKAESIERLLAYIDSYGFDAKKQKADLRAKLDEIRKETAVTINDFLIKDDANLAIFELADISNSKAGLRLTEIYLSTIMDWARGNRRARQVLLCLEEAHTIVPEAYGSGFDGETKWVVERIGQIALQGRKYGVGLLVITQRTALVSKTILSQCNTFLTHSLIDQTSLNFLESVYSSQHTRLIPNLGRFEFLAFGKAIKAERPVILMREFDQTKHDASQAMNKPVPDVVEDAAVEVKDKNEDGPHIKQS